MSFAGDEFLPADDDAFGPFDDEPMGLSDVEADADTLASVGWGTDEDYSYFGGDEL